MADVFISYSRHDGAFVRELHGFLARAGRDVWVDWEDIPPASQWEQDIDDSIDAAESVVFVVSPSSLASQYCLEELRHAQERGKRIVPLACDAADPGAAPEGLRQLNWIWCRDGDDTDAAFAKLTSALDTDLEWAKAHTRLLVRAVEWDARRDGSLLLRGRDLEEAARQLALNAGKEPAPTELQQRYLHESRRAATRRQRILLGGVSVALAVSIALGVLALLQRNDARRATRKATSVALASTATLRLASKPDQALLLALAAYRLSASAQARNAVVTALQAVHGLGVTAFQHGDTELRALAFGPDGRTLAVGSAGGPVRLWSAQPGGSLRQAAPAAPRPVVGVSVARAGTLVLAARADGRLQLRDARSGLQVGRTLVAPHAIVAAAVSADGTAAAATDGAGHLWLWDVRSGTRRDLRAPKGGIARLAFSPDGRTLAAAATDTTDVEEGSPGAVWLVDVASGAPAGLQSGASVYGIAFSPDGAELAVAGFEDEGAGRYQPSATYGEVVLWRVRDRKAVGLLRTRGPVESVAFGRGGTVVAGLDDGTIRAGLPRARRWTGVPLRAAAGPVTLLAVGGDGRTVAAAGSGADSVRVWNLGEPARLDRTLARATLIYGMAVSPDGATVAGADAYDGVLLVPTRPRGRTTLLRVPHSQASVEEVAFSGDGRTLAASSDDGAVHLFRLPRGAFAGRLPRLRGVLGAQELALDESGRLLAAVDETGTLRLWNVPRRRLYDLQPDLKNVVAARFLDRGRTLALVGYDGVYELWDAAQGRRVRRWTLPVGQVTGAAFAADGRTLALATSSGVRIWSERSRGSAAEAGAGGLLALSADGRTLAAAVKGGIQLWDVRAVQPLGEPLPETSYARAGFTPDGTGLVSSDQTGVQLWQGMLWRDAADLRARVCALVVGDLTRAEWAAVAPGVAYRTTCRG